MGLLLRFCSTLLFVLLTACAPSLRITPGQLPSADVPDQNLRTEAEQYVTGYIHEEKFREITSGPQLVRVTNIIEKLSRAAGYPPRSFPVHLVDAGEEVNAAAVNGASIIVYKELLVRAKSDTDIATVLGHEIGHIIAKHYKDQEEEKSRASAVDIASSVFGAVASIATSAAGYGGASDLVGDVTETTTGLVGYGAFVGSFSRTQEYEADHLGLLIMAKAGYNPSSAIDFWNHADEVFGSSSTSVGSFFSTHPASGDRMTALKEALPYAMAYYQPAKGSEPATKKATQSKKKKS